MRGLIVLALVAALPCAAKPVKVAPWMTGERLRELVTFPPEIKGNFDMTPGQYLDAERGRLYIEGVHDSSAERSWCNNKQYPAGPDAVVDAAIVGLRKLSHEQLKRNASDLVVEIWRQRWPCPANGAAR